MFIRACLFPLRPTCQMAACTVSHRGNNVGLWETSKAISALVLWPVWHSHTGLCVIFRIPFDILYSDLVRGCVHVDQIYFEARALWIRPSNKAVERLLHVILRCLLPCLREISQWAEAAGIDAQPAEALMCWDLYIVAITYTWYSSMTPLLFIATSLSLVEQSLQAGWGCAPAKHAIWQ